MCIRDRVNYIESPDGEYTYFEYADGSAPTALTKVKYPDGTYTQYQYDGDGRLIKIMRPDGYRTEISYEDGRVKRIQELAPNPNGSGDEEGKWRSFTYYSYLSSRVTFDNTSYVYDFDSYGRTISINPVSYTHLHPGHPLQKNLSALPASLPICLDKQVSYSTVSF